MKTTGDIQVEGTVEGDIRAHLLTVGESATIKGEVIADDVVVNGQSLVGCGLKAPNGDGAWKAISFIKQSRLNRGRISKVLFSAKTIH